MTAAAVLAAAGRLSAAAITVDSTLDSAADDGVCTLRQTISPSATLPGITTPIGRRPPPVLSERRRHHP